MSGLRAYAPILAVIALCALPDGIERLLQPRVEQVRACLAPPHRREDLDLRLWIKPKARRNASRNHLKDRVGGALRSGSLEHKELSVRPVRGPGGRRIRILCAFLTGSGFPPLAEDLRQTNGRHSF